MNLAESMRFVLRHRTPELFSHFWREDLAAVMGEGLRELKHKGAVLRDRSALRNSLADAYVVVKVTPRRVNHALACLGEELAAEFERRADPRDRAEFCLQVLREVLLASASTVGGASPAGFLGRTAFARFIIGKLVFRISQRFVLRFLDEVEAQIDLVDEKDQVRGFRAKILAGGAALENLVVELNPDDEVREILRNFKARTLTGRRPGDKLASRS